MLTGATDMAQIARREPILWRRVARTDDERLAEASLFKWSSTCGIQRCKSPRAPVNQTQSALFQNF